MPFPESFNDGPIPSSSKGRERLGEILLADLSYFNQARLNVSSEEQPGDGISNAGLSLHEHVVQTNIETKKNNKTQAHRAGFLDLCDVRVSAQFSFPHAQL